jgi:biotin carboxyl carrier protein
MIISGDSDGSSGSFHLGHVATQVLSFTLFAIIVALVCFVVHSAITVSSLRKQSAKQASQILELEEANASLESTNSELQSEVTQLSQALNQKVEAEAQSAAAEEELSMPTLLPISNGTASMVSYFDDPNSTEINLPKEKTEGDDAGDEDEENTEEAASEEPTGDPILIITAEKGATVIASGSGTVTSVTADIKYGNVITIDHGNGYISMYRNKGNSLVHEGDSVSRGATLIVIDDDNTTLGYQIKSGDSFINPEDLVEING